MLKAFKSTAAALVMVGTVGFVAAPALANAKAAAPKPAATKTMTHKATKVAKKMANPKAVKHMAKKGAMKKK
jgi:hypothetical protein